MTPISYRIHYKSPEVKNFEAFGAGNVTRTHDLLITNQLLYRLSYTSIFFAAL